MPKDERFANPLFEKSLDGWTVSGATWDSQYQGRCSLNSGYIQQMANLTRVKRIIARVSVGSVRILVDGVGIADIAAGDTTPYGEVDLVGLHLVTFQDLSGSSILSSVSASGSHRAPSADFSASPVSGLAPLTVHFMDTSDPNGDPIISWEWTFEGYGTSGSPNPSCTFHEPGKYTVSLKVDNGYGTSRCTASNLIVVGTPEPGWPSGEWVKVGRLRPGEGGTVVINHDQLGDIGVLTVFQVQELLNGVDPQDIKTGPFNLLKAGEADLSVPATGCKMVIPTDTGRLYVAITRQVENMLAKWPEKKAALWTPKMWGIEFMEAVFDVTGRSCTGITDINREWGASILGKILIPVTGPYAGCPYRIISYFNHEYVLVRDDGPYYQVDLSTASVFSSNGAPVPSITETIKIQIKGSSSWFNRDSGVTIPFVDLWWARQVLVVWRGMYNMPGWEGGTVGRYESPSLTFQFQDEIGGAPKPIADLYSYGHPDYMKTLKPIAQNLAGTLTIKNSTNGNNQTAYLEIRDILFLTDDCPGYDFEVGDKYMILDPIRREYLLDDNALPLVNQEYWRASSGIGDSITTTPVQYYWDGTGTVFLTSHPKRVSPIMYDNELRVEVQNGTDLRVRDYAPGAEVIEHEEFHISRDTPDITSLCRPGINTVTISVRDANAGKVGFCTEVYVKRRK